MSAQRSSPRTPPGPSPNRSARSSRCSSSLTTAGWRSPSGGSASRGATWRRGGGGFVIAAPAGAGRQSPMSACRRRCRVVAVVVAQQQRRRPRQGASDAKSPLLLLAPSRFVPCAVDRRRRWQKCLARRSDDASSGACPPPLDRYSARRQSSLLRLLSCSDPMPSSSCAPGLSSPLRLLETPPPAATISPLPPPESAAPAPSAGAADTAGGTFGNFCFACRPGGPALSFVCANTNVGRRSGHRALSPRAQFPQAGARGGGAGGARGGRTRTLRGAMNPPASRYLRAAGQRAGAHLAPTLFSAPPLSRPGP